MTDGDTREKKCCEGETRVKKREVVVENQRNLREMVRYGKHRLWVRIRKRTELRIL